MKPGQQVKLTQVVKRWFLEVRPEQILDLDLDGVFTIVEYDRNLNTDVNLIVSQGNRQIIMGTEYFDTVE